MKLLRPLVFVVLTLATAGAALAQTSTRGRTTGGEPRIDLNKLTGSSNSVHNVRLSGSYYLSANIKVGAGMSAITIDAAASAVTIDFNGFGIEGAPGGTSGNGIDCPAALIPRQVLKTYRFSASGLGGDGMSIDSVDSVEVVGAHVSQCGGDGISLKHSRKNGSIVSGNFNYCHRGISLVDVGSVQITDVSVSSCDVGIEACAEALLLEGAAIQGCTTDGILLDDSCSAPGVVGRTRSFKIGQCVAMDSGGDGIELSSTGASTMLLTASDLVVTNSGGHGLHIPVVPAGAPNVGPPEVKLRDATLLGNGGSGIYAAGVAGGTKSTHHHYAHVDCSRNALDGISIGSGGTLEGESISANDNGSNGIEVVFGSGGPSPVGKVRLTGVQCSDNGFDGCQLDGSTPIIRGTALLQDFHFVGNGRDGWSMTNFDATALHGTIEGNARDGIHAVDGDLSTSNTGIGSNGNDGLSLLRIRHRGWDGTIYGTHRSGVRATDSQLHVQGILVDGCVEDGVHLESSTYEHHGGSLTGCGFQGISATYTPVVMDKVFVGGNTGGGVRLVSSSAQCTGLEVVGNGGDGIEAIAPSTGPSMVLDFHDGVLDGNSGFGAKTTGKSVPKFLDYMTRSNAAGGILCTSGGSCAPVLVHFSGCTFDENGGTALDLQNAGGGLVERITILSSSIGLHVGDPAGLGCSSGVRISDCTVGQCVTGYSIDPGGGHLVTRNFASQCSGAPFAVGAGNLCGPIISTQGDMLTATNPNANFAQ